MHCCFQVTELFDGIQKSRFIFHLVKQAAGNYKIELLVLQLHSHMLDPVVDNLHVFGKFNIPTHELRRFNYDIFFIFTIVPETKIIRRTNIKNSSCSMLTQA